MRVLRVVTLGSATGAYGGPFDTATRQAELAASDGMSVSLLFGTLHGDEPNWQSETVRPVCVPVRRYSRRLPFTSLASIRAIWELIRNVRQAEVVHVSYAREFIPLVAAVLALAFHRRLILQPHGMITTGTGLRWRPLEVAVKAVARRAESLIALTAVERGHLLEWEPRLPTIRILGNPLDPRVPAISSRQPEPNTVLFLARIHERKRPDVFAAAADVALERGWEERYVMVGPDGGELASLLGPNRSCVYEGPVAADEVAHRIAKANVFVLCSKDEPWGNSLVTALALGLPCVVSTSAALAADLADADAALVVPDGSAQSLADAVHRVLHDPQLSDILGAGARKFVKDRLGSEAQRSSLSSIYRGGLQEVKVN